MNVDAEDQIWRQMVKARPGAKSRQKESARAGSGSKSFRKRHGSERKRGQKGSGGSLAALGLL